MISTLHLALIIHVTYLIIQCTSFSLPTPQLLNKHPGDGNSNSDDNGDGDGDDNGDDNGDGNGGIQNVLQAIRIPTNAPEPIIVTLPNLIPPNQINNLLHNIESARKLGDLKPTNSYQEDVFSRDLQKDENAFFRSMVQPLVDDNLIPSEYCEDKDKDTDTDKALEMFVYAVTNYQERLNEEDIIHGANIIQRRQAFERWKSEEGRAIMKLSLDTDMDVVTDTDTDDDADDTLCLGKRFQMPTKVLADLKLLIPQILKGYWEVKDATIVQYALGDTQVPHIDPCDATILICLKNCQEGDGGDGGGGGDTCFPMLEIPSSRRLENRAGCGILFFSSEYEEEEAMDIDADSDTDTDVNSRNRNALSLHHGGKVTSGEKIVVQLMLDWVAPSPGKITSGVNERAQIVAGSITNTNRGIGTGKGSWIDVLACL